MVVAFSIVVVKMDMAEISKFKELIEVPIQPGMAAVERAVKAAGGKFRQERRRAEMTAFPRSHVLHTDHDSTFFLQAGQGIE
jgi:hypothetical protein